jgi:hypothetical protein
MKREPEDIGTRATKRRNCLDMLVQLRRSIRDWIWIKDSYKNKLSDILCGDLKSLDNIHVSIGYIVDNSLFGQFNVGGYVENTVVTGF